MIFATMKDGERIAARGGVYMRPIVRVSRADETIFVRSHRWTRYITKSDGRTRVTGTGSATTGIAAVASARELREKWPETARLLRGFS